MTKEELKILSDQSFFDNDNGEIQPEHHRNFNDNLIESIAIESVVNQHLSEKASFTDYSSLVEKIIPGETMLNNSGNPRQVYIKSYMFFTTGTGGAVTIERGVDAAAIVLMRVRATAVSQSSDLVVPNLRVVVLNNGDVNVIALSAGDQANKPITMTLKYTKL